MNDKGRGKEPERLGDFLGNVVSLPNSKSRPCDDKLVKRALDLYDKEFSQKDLGFTSRILVQANLPYRNPKGNPPAWTKKNGDFYLTLQPMVRFIEGKEINYGYPYGNIPRLVLIYLCTQAIRTKSPKIDLGDSMAEFMRMIGMDGSSKSGGKRGGYNRLKDQLRRLLTCHIHFSFVGQLEAGSVEVGRKSSIAAEWTLWWDNRLQDTKHKPPLNSHAVLDNAFFEEIMKHPVPLNMEIIAGLKDTPAALDMYCWLNHRNSYLKKPIKLLWKDVMNQMGSDMATVKDFKTKVAKPSLKKVKLLWPNLKVHEVTGGFILQPSSPSVPKKTFRSTSLPKTDSKRDTEAEHRGF